MSYFQCPPCSERTEIFGHGEAASKRHTWEFPAWPRCPLHPAIREAGDAGKPLAVGDPESPRSQIFYEIAERLQSALGEPAASAMDRS